MKYFLILILVVLVVPVYGQTAIDFSNIINKWTQGGIDSTGNVVQADWLEGDLFQFDIREDYTATYTSSFDCGYGNGISSGKWKIDLKDTTIVFSFTKVIYRRGNHNEEDIDETEIYKIRKLTNDQLIFSQIKDGRVLIKPCILYENIKHK